MQIHISMILDRCIPLFLTYIIASCTLIIRRAPAIISGNLRPLVCSHYLINLFLSRISDKDASRLPSKINSQRLISRWRTKFLREILAGSLFRLAPFRFARSKIPCGSVCVSTVAHTHKLGVDVRANVRALAAFT